MKIETTHHVDAGEHNAAGLYDCYYEYDIYRFTEGNVSFLVRRYADSPAEARFLSIEVDGQRRLLTEADLELPLFAQAIRHLRHAGKQELNWLSGRSGEYEPVVRSR